MLKIEYAGSNKVIKALCKAVNHFIDKDYETDEAYAHAQLISGNPHHVTAEELGLGGVWEAINTIMTKLGLIVIWATNNDECIVTNDGDYIAFHVEEET